MNNSSINCIPKIFFCLLAAISGLVFSCSSFGAEYPNPEGIGSLLDKNAGWYQQCLRVKDATPPQSDIPSKQLLSSLEGCEPIDLYYDTKGEDQPSNADWSKVRACAFANNDNSVLMMVYANGFGVKRNLELALKYACSEGGALFEVEGRVGHLTWMIEKSSSNEYEFEVFDICDHITSGFMMGLCAAWSERQNEKVRNNQLEEIISLWNPAQKSAFEKLRKSATDFAEAVGSRETDQMGSARGALVTEARAEEMESFINDVEQFEKGHLPIFTKDQFVRLDKRLNQAYKKLMHSKTTGEYGRFGFSTIVKSDVLETQKLWLKFRDAWVNLGHARYPSVEAYSWKALLTERRIKHLETLQEYADEK